jgi:hypothetical protein
MKRSILGISIILLFLLLPFFITGVVADPPEPLGPGGNPNGGGGIPVGGPIEDSVGILLALSIAYGSYKISGIWKKMDALKKGEVY